MSDVSLGIPFVVLEVLIATSHLQLQAQARPPFIQTRFHVWLTDSSTRYPTYPLCEVNGFSLTKYKEKGGDVSGINLEFVSIRAYKCSSSAN